VHHYEPENKAQSMDRKRQTSPVAKKFKSQTSVSKTMFTIFGGDVEGAILVHTVQTSMPVISTDLMLIIKYTFEFHIFIQVSIIEVRPKQQTSHKMNFYTVVGFSESCIVEIQTRNVS
jgi:hypothetical protein